MRKLHFPIVSMILLILFCFAHPAHATAYKSPYKKAPRNLTQEEMMRVEGYMNYFADALYRFYCINGEYPISFKYLLNSGLIVAWPINPLSGKPVRVVKAIEKEDYEFAGDICYVNHSSDEGYFAGIFQTERTGVWKYMKFPDVIDKTAYIQLKKKNPESYTEEPPVRFAKSIVSLFGTLKTLNLDVREHLPQSTSELFNNDFRILREFYNPVYTGTDENTAGFFELGVDIQSGFWFSKYRTYGEYTHKFALKFPYMDLKLMDREFVDERFPILKSPIMLLSSSRYPTSRDLPEEIVISTDDLEFTGSNR